MMIENQQKGRAVNNTDRGGNVSNSDPNDKKPKFELADRGKSDGRHEPKNEDERKALEAVMADPLLGEELNITMGDIRWPAEEGWIKMEYKSGRVRIHYVLNMDLAEVDDFKFK